jgi:hypothetical protein
MEKKICCCFCVCGEDFSLTNFQGFVLLRIVEVFVSSEEGMRSYIICRFRMKYVMDVCHLLLPCSCLLCSFLPCLLTGLLSFALSSNWYMAEKEKKNIPKNSIMMLVFMQSLLDITNALLHLFLFLSISPSSCTLHACIYCRVLPSLYFNAHSPRHWCNCHHPHV